ncbi:DNA polymerase alpha/epsilon subunit B-domain-containing protein [Blakeslea trispora]|nr:DNA polymerase alpha/epsilon subunit B-domain-containing protein [Blakeslea trispora]
MNTIAEVQRVFELNLPQENDLAQELHNVCTTYSITPDNLKFKWEAFALNSGCSIKPTIPYIKHLRNSLKREFDRSVKARKTTQGKVVTKRTTALDLSDYGIAQTKNDSVEDFMSSMLGGMSRQHNKVIPTSATPLSDTQISSVSSQFLTRKAAHVIESQYNPELPLIEKPEDTSSLSDIHFSHLQYPVQEYRYMFEKIKERADTLDERIEYMGSLIAEAHQIPSESFSNPTRPNQESVYAYGRICSDVTSESEGRLNARSVMLQTSKELGMGRRVKLDLAGLDSYSLFPGQIVGLYGRNTLGDVFFVEKLLMPPMPEKHVLPSVEQNRPLEMITAAGPFTFNDDLSFQPLEDLLQMCATQKPDIVLLMGPFISSQHPRLVSGKIETLPEQLFVEHIGKRLEQLADHLKQTHILLVPHQDDIIQMYPLFPQPSLPDLIKHQRVHMLSNPSLIGINDHTIAVGHIDILFRLAREEISKNIQGDRMQTLAQHVLEQHTYYPLFPHAIGDSIDSSQLHHIQISRKPDVLILPSQLKHFTRDVQGTVCMNPGHLSKGLSSGSYARVLMYPSNDDTNPVRVDLFKL